MLFNSFPFIFVFLPVTLAGFLILGSLASRQWSLRWIVACSMAFYGIWVPHNLIIIMLSVVTNYIIATKIRDCIASDRPNEKLATILLTFGITANLLFLGYFKYMNFFVENLNEVLGLDLGISKVLLPLGISFITFQKIGFLIDVRARNVKQFTLDDFFVFVFFFPQLIAGPIVHYREMMPQFDQLKTRLNSADFVVGISLFSLGLFKKVILADGIVPYVSPGFTAAANGVPVTLFAAWTSALAFSFQIYFDFSGYTDMALGLARMFGIRLPMNFNSPFKASSIIEFWSRWHITLTRFLTDYLYTPIVMKLTRSRMRSGKPVMGRKAPTVTAFLVLVFWPMMLTMLLSGFWHGAGYTYILWGGMHGALLVINHAWREWRPKTWDRATYDRVMTPVGFFITFFSVVFTMVIFRAGSVDEAVGVYRGMLGFNGASMPVAVLNELGAVKDVLLSLGITPDISSGNYFVFSSLWICGLLFIALFVPNSMEIMRRFEPALYFDANVDHGHQWRFLASRRNTFIFSLCNRWAFCMALIFLIGVLGLNRPSEFLYWQF